MYVVTVTFRVVHDQLDAFLTLMQENAQLSLADEPGCRQFDVCQTPDDPAEIFLYELYDDAAAFEAHKTMPHFLAFSAQTDAMVTHKALRIYTRCAP